ncbi:hypothetical protein [Leucobacter chinensis]|uniref:hypothetical protein n=1 Tax=Leucobacter chinensis TaxID=2851010 RepID=UPI001C231D6B|nr:hypothetical protein [Leucobacter chinensis]
MAAPVAVAAASTVAKHWKAILGIIAVILLVPVILLGLVITSVFAAETSSQEKEQEQVVNVSGPAVIGSCAPDCAGADGPQSHVSVKRMLEVALSEVGTSRPTGHNMPGECIVSVRRWVGAAGGNFGCCGAREGRLTAGLLEVSDGSLRPGDVVQYESYAFPNGYPWGVHTYMVLAVHDDGTHDIIESNVPFASGLVGIRKNQRLTPPPGFRAVVWRIAGQPDV